jgi:hypothetical protein
MTAIAMIGTGPACPAIASAVSWAGITWSWAPRPGANRRQRWPVALDQLPARPRRPRQREWATSWSCQSQEPAFASLRAAPLAGKVVICTPGDTSRNEDRDEEEGDSRVTNADLLQHELPARYVVEALSTVAVASVTPDGSPPSTSGRRALPLAGDLPAAQKIVADLYDRLGYDPVDADPFQRELAGSAAASLAPPSRRPLTSWQSPCSGRGASSRRGRPCAARIRSELQAGERAQQRGQQLDLAG